MPTLRELLQEGDARVKRGEIEQGLASVRFAEAELARVARLLSFN